MEENHFQYFYVRSREWIFISVISHTILGLPRTESDAINSVVIRRAIWSFEFDEFDEKTFDTSLHYIFKSLELPLEKKWKREPMT